MGDNIDGFWPQWLFFQPLYNIDSDEPEIDEILVSGHDFLSQSIFNLYLEVKVDCKANNAD